MEEDYPIIIQKILAFMKHILDLLFRPGSSRLSRWIDRLWYVGLYLFGSVVWGYFLNWGGLNFDVHDWTQEGPRYSFIRQALLENRFPLHIGTPLASTERFLSIPDTMISPQVLLLRFFEPALFVLINTLFLYTIGYVGLLLIRRRFKWSPVTFLVVFLLFSLNGHPIAHIAVGHSMWISYFLLPFFVLLILDLLEGRAGWKWVAQLALLQLVVYLQGGFHFVNWCLMFLTILGIASFRHLKPILKALLFSLLVSMPRILPVLLEFTENRRFISGYFSVTDLLAALTTIRPPEEALSGMYSAFGWWEVDVYTGFLGLGFIIIFGLFLTLRDRDREQISHLSLLAPIFIMTTLSIGKIFQPLTLLPVPLVSTERVASRFIIIPIVMLIVLGGIQLDRFLRRWSGEFGGQIAVLILVGIMGHDLLQHARLWRVENMGLLFPITAVDIRAEVLSRNDPPYLAAILGGLGIALIAWVYLLIMARRENGRSINLGQRSRGMGDRRKLTRRHLKNYLQVYDRDTGTLIGKLVDITSKGVMLVDQHSIEPGKEYKLRADLPSTISGKREIIFDARSMWCDQDSVNPDHYATGFQLVEIDEEDVKLIERLIRDFGLKSIKKVQGEDPD